MSGSALSVANEVEDVDIALNEPVPAMELDFGNSQLPLYFLHIPKTAGTSLTNFLDGHYDADDIAPRSNWNDYLVDLNHAKLLKAAKPAAHYKLIRGHFGWGMWRELGRRPRYITMLRDPIERVLSQFEHLDKERVHNNWVDRNFYNPPFSLDALLRDERRRLFFSNTQCRYLVMDIDMKAIACKRYAHDLFNFNMDSQPEFMNVGYCDDELRDKAYARLKECAFFGIQEYSEESFIFLSCIAGWLGAEACNAHTSNRTFTRDQLSEASQAVLHEINRADAWLHKQATGLFLKRYVGTVNRLFNTKLSINEFLKDKSRINQEFRYSMGQRSVPAESLMASATSVSKNGHVIPFAHDVPLESDRKQMKHGFPLPTPLKQAIINTPVIGPTARRNWRRINERRSIHDQLDRIIDLLGGAGGSALHRNGERSNELFGHGGHTNEANHGVFANLSTGDQQIVLNKLHDIYQKVSQLNTRPAACYMGNNTILAQVQGFKMLMPSDDVGLTPHLILEGFWEQWVHTAFVRCIKPGMTVIDVGANIGYFTLLACRDVGSQGRVLAFEPEPRNHQFLSWNVQLCGARWCTPVNKALWNSTGTSKLYIRSDSFCGGHSMVPGGSVREVPIETVTLDEYLGDNNKVDVMKIDAEGAEPAIIEGMARTIKANSKIRILMEYCPEFIRAANRDPIEFLYQLQRMGLRVEFIDHDSSLKPIDIPNVEKLSDAWPEMFMLSKG